MEYTVNQQNIQKYAERLTNDLCRQFFINKAFISGPEILSFNSESQLNLLIIKNIYLNWQKETLKLKSIYFDYEDEEVKNALTNFMNILSNHIKVYRFDFEALLKVSIADYILLAAAPQTFFTKETEALAGPKISLHLLKDFSKYVKVNKFVLDQVIREIETSGYTETFGGETIRFILKALNENPHKIESGDDVLKGLFEQLPASVTEFVTVPKPLVTRPAFLDNPKPEPVAPEPVQFVKAVAEPVVEPPVYEPVVEADLQPENQEETEELVAETKAPEADLPVADEPEPIFQKPEPTLRPQKVMQTTEAAELAMSPITLNETLKESEKAQSLTEALQVKTVAAPFKTLVPMHYRFTFINALFGGNQQAWAEAVEKIDASATYDDAVSMLKSQYGGTYNWDQDEDNVLILMNYVERKF